MTYGAVMRCWFGLRSDAGTINNLVERDCSELELVLLCLVLLSSVVLFCVCSCAHLPQGLHMVSLVLEDRAARECACRAGAPV